MFTTTGHRLVVLVWGWYCLGRFEKGESDEQHDVVSLS